MKLKIRDLGPIKRGDIELGDITLLLGPPNTGKSYTLKALYAKLFPLDNSALEIFNKQLKINMLKNLERIESISGFSYLDKYIRDLIRISIISPMAIMLDNKEWLDNKAKNKKIRLSVRRFRSTVSIHLTTPEIIVRLTGREINDSLNKTIQDFMSDLVPIKSLDSVILEPFDPYRIDLASILKNLGIDGETVEVKLSTYRFPADNMMDTMYIFYLDSSRIRRLILRSEMGDRRQFEELYDALLYMSDQIREADVKQGLVMEISGSSGSLVMKIHPFISIRLPGLLIKEMKFKQLREEISPMVAKEFLSYLFENAYTTRNTDRIVSFMRHAIFERIADYVSKSILLSAIKAITIANTGYTNIRFIPFGRSILLLGLEGASREPFGRSELLQKFMKDFYPSIMTSYIYWSSKGRALFLENKLLPEQRAILKAAQPLLEGNLIPEDSGRLSYQDWRGSKVMLNMSSALVSEVSGILLPLLGIERESIVLIEEPESQLHPGAQVIMAIFLSALPELCGCKVVTTTHSDLLAITLSQLALLKPDRDDIKRLVSRLIPSNIKGIDMLTNASSESSKNIDLRIYEFTREGTIKKTDPRNVVSKEVPSISKVINELISWSMDLSTKSYR